MLGKHAGDELRGSVRPPGPQIFDASPKRAFELTWQGRKEALKKLSHFAAHPFAGEILLTSQGEDHAGAGKGAADIEYARGFIKADRPIAAHDTKQRLAVDAADLCYIVLRGSTFLASSYLMALGLPLLFFLLISGGDAGVFFAHLANIADRFLGAEQGRQVGFLDEFKFVLIGVATLVVVWRLPRFINDLERELSGEKL